METLCYIREIYQAIAEFENYFHKTHDLCLNEGMLLCVLKEGPLTSGEIAKKLNLSQSNTSKVLRSVEMKGLILRDLGEKDRRQMYYSVTQEGVKKLSSLKCEKEQLPEILKCIANNHDK
ncbi:winged helix DNA-binding protein [Coprobacter tertius]|uniref:Winged helix DNA-binding protein n=1 Tax=Coprobacter tertius TaxID=2944915 RepID=A0ABT1MJR0_9BACT|nr:winged helix DNA-binding protein [Coprobacter tertius]MCP9612874.1 winged helix DNA-binding protein [Coprobacter tertius]